MQQSVMRRVYLIWAFRRIVNSVTLKFAALISLLAIVRQYASIKHVLYNSPSFLDTSASLGFWTHAFAHASVVVEAGVLGIATLGVFLVRDFVATR